MFCKLKIGLFIDFRNTRLVADDACCGQVCKVRKAKSEFASFSFASWPIGPLWQTILTSKTLWVQKLQIGLKVREPLVFKTSLYQILTVSLDKVNTNKRFQNQENCSFLY